MEEKTFKLNGLEIAAKIWGNPNGIPTLALHGWLDNAASFDHIAPLLPELYLVAIDLPGHGHSSHYPQDIPIHFIDFVINMIKFIDHLGWHQFALLGHSLGGAIASILAGTLPERILNVALIDAIGPMTTPAEHAPMQLRLFASEMLKEYNPSTIRYDSIEQPVQSRIRVSQMRESSARAIITRNLIQSSDLRWQWRTDPRLLKPSALQLTEEQTLAFLREIKAPVTIIRPEPGFPFSEAIIRGRLEAIPHIEIEKIPGQHHVHLDDPENVASILHRVFAIH